MPQTAFEQIEQLVKLQGLAAGLDDLVARLRANASYYELFEALKMHVRHGLGLPIMYDDSGDDLDDPLRQQLEEGLLGACREVGLALVRGGQVREGWAYLRPVGNQSEVQEALRAIEPGEDNLDELIEVSLHEGVDPARGYSLVLKNYGTCNAITSLESLHARLPVSDRQATTALLVDHVHQELFASVVADISNREGSAPEGDTLESVIQDRPWLFGEHSYHIDTTHLASTVRLARALESKTELRLAVDLTEYGRRLSDPFQYAGEEPFVELYPSHGLYLQALLGIEVDAAIDYFHRRAQELDPEQHGTQPTETLIELLDRLTRYDEAIDVLLEFAQRTPKNTSQAIPLLLSLSQKANDFTKVIDYCRDCEDLLGFTTALLQSAAKKS